MKYISKQYIASRIYEGDVFPKSCFVHQYNYVPFYFSVFIRKTKPQCIFLSLYLSIFHYLLLYCKYLREITMIHAYSSFQFFRPKIYTIYGSSIGIIMGLVARKPVFGGLRITKAQTSLRVRAVWSAPLLFAYWKVSYLYLLQGNFRFSS